MNSIYSIEIRPYLHRAFQGNDHRIRFWYVIFDEAGRPLADAGGWISKEDAEQAAERRRGELRRQARLDWGMKD